MVEFTVQEMFDLFGKAEPPLRFVWAQGEWVIEAEHSFSFVARGKTPDGLRKALEARAIPTAEEALALLDKIVIPESLEDYRPEIIACYRGVRRCLEAHKEQPDA